MTPILYPESGHIPLYPTGEDLADRSVPPFRVWVPERTILVIGYSQVAEAELNSDAIREDGIPVYKRKGGGGAVLLSPNCVCVGLRFRRHAAQGITDFFAASNGFISRTLHEGFNVDLAPRGISDLASDDRKVLGSSMHLSRDCALYFASILVDVSPTLLDHYLRHPSREPDYREGRTHDAFVRNLIDIPDLDKITPFSLREVLEKKVSDRDTVPDLDWLD